jgi:very-short-patch-repair endonuclease/predicted  nucleic acid-binding Zn-ribbon protein
VAKLNTKIEYWKNRLLDLGKRNRLINCTLPKSGGSRVSRTALLIQHPDYKELWNTFVERDASLQFYIEEDEQLPLSIGAAEHSKPKFSSSIVTNQSPAETYKTLRSLMKKAKEFTEEKGLNALYLAVGFLNWKENGTEGQEMRSPLVLVPAELRQDSINDPIVLSRSDDELTANRALEQKLLNDFGITLPQFDEDNWQDYLSQVDSICSAMKWQVTCDATQLSLFSFLKINMYRDLELHIDEISGHHIVRALNGEAFDSGINVSELSDYNHDATEPQEVFSVVDADSSQQDAILLAKQGVSFVLQGPPGTGKSQTITNIIAELIADGKKVLFVSEKMAALDVVHRRLKQAGISDFCLTLHSHNANRKEILNQLENSLKLSRHKAQLQQEAFNQLYQLKDTRSSLNAYVQELHTTVNPLGRTIFEVNGFVASYGAYKNIDYIQQGAESFTPEILAQCQTALEELMRIVDKSGYQQSNPWNGCILTSVTHEFRQQFLVDTKKLSAFIDVAIQLFTDFIEMAGATKMPQSFTTAAKMSLLLTAVSQSPNMPHSWLKRELIEQIPLVDDCIVTLKIISGVETFISKLDPNTRTFISAIDEIFVCTTSDNENQKDLVAAYDATSEVFIKSLPTSDFTTSVSRFRAGFISLCQLRSDFDVATLHCNQAKTAVSMLQQSLETEKETLRDKERAWQNICDSLSSEFDENVLSIDAERMLSRYRTSYRSGLSRTFSSAYHKDRKILLAYCKLDTKMNYSEALVFLDKIVMVQTVKIEYANQTERTNKVEDLLKGNENEFSRFQADISSLTDKITTALQQFTNAKQELVKKIDDCLNDYEAQLSEKKTHFAETTQMLCGALSIGVTSQTDFIELKNKLELAIALQAEVGCYGMADDFMQKICARDVIVIERFIKSVTSLIEWANDMEQHLAKFSSLFENDRSGQFASVPLDDLKRAVQLCHDNLASLEYLIDYRNAERHLTSLGIDLYLQKAKLLNLSAREIVPIFLKCFYRSWLDVVVPKFPAVYAFRRERQDERISKFKNLDKSHMEISKAALLTRLISHLPSFDTFSANGGEISLLRREMAKQRKLMPIRKLIAAMPNLLPAIKPCMMMSPLSVSTYLGSSGYEFDTVVFDEASQVRTEDAICSIFRAKQAIIAGDSKQLPPTDFFSSSITESGEFEEDDEGEINDAGAYESLLDEAVILPTQTLLWHYRSKHEHLIAFSNKKIYNDKLITFPSSVEKAEGMGVEYIHVPGGIYERGGKNGNRAEAEQIAKLVFEHFDKHPNRSLGVIAFGEVQQAAIEDAIERKRQQNPQYELFFKDNKEESVFIKNLETVQGDERDTIIFSIGYAPDAAGKFIMNFGPLSRIGGERRLNVAVTRARCNLKLVGSIQPTDIKVDQVSGVGPKLLRQYIDFAINGARAILGEITLNGDGWFDSPFEESVYNFLTANEYDVSTQVGCSGYRIDMAVRHRAYNGRFAIGIECDGRAYHSSRTARERDRLRQTVLEDMGWTIYRIWSTDWIKDQRTEGDRLLKAVETAMNSYREEPKPREASAPKSTDFMAISAKSAAESEQEKLSIIKSGYWGYNAVEIPVVDFEKTMLRVLESEFGLDKPALFKETALYGYGWQRQGSTIKERFEQTYRDLLGKNKIEEVEGKINIIM